MCALVSFVLNWWIWYLTSFVIQVNLLYFTFVGLFRFHLWVYMCIFHYFNHYLPDFVTAICLRFILVSHFGYLFVFPLMGKVEWGGNPVCYWLGLYFCFVCCLDEVSCTGCYWWLGNGGSCIQVVSFVWVLTIWYPLGLVLCSLASWSQRSHSKGSGLDLWSGMKIPQVVCYGIKWD